MVKRTDNRTAKRISWDYWYLLACRYKAEYGNLLVPRAFIMDGYKLGRWIERQRAAYAGKGAYIIDADQISRLEQLGMAWSLEQRFPFAQWLALAAAYRAEYHALFVPKTCVYHGMALGSWINEQRKLYRKQQLSPKKIEQLEQLGMVWSLIHRPPFEVWLDLARQYHTKFGNLDVPSQYRTENGYQLGAWLGTQRERYKGTRAPLSVQEIAALDELGMVWAPYDKKWMDMYQRAAAYYQECGHLLIPQTYKTADGSALGSWISKQRYFYRRREIRDYPKFRKTMLDKIGMVWDPFQPDQSQPDASPSLHLTVLVPQSSCKNAAAHAR